MNPKFFLSPSLCLKFLTEGEREGESEGEREGESESEREGEKKSKHKVVSCDNIS